MPGLAIHFAFQPCVAIQEIETEPPQCRAGKNAPVFNSMREADHKARPAGGDTLPQIAQSLQSCHRRNVQIG